MNLEEQIRTALLAMNAVTAIVGTGDAARIRPDRLPQGEQLPAIFVEVDDDDKLNDLDGIGGLGVAQVVVTCRAWTRGESRQLAEAVRTNGTTPGTGLAGYSGASFSAVLDSMPTALTPAEDGTDRAYYDTAMDFEVTYREAT